MAHQINVYVAAKHAHHRYRCMISALFSVFLLFNSFIPKRTHGFLSTKLCFVLYPTNDSKGVASVIKNLH